MELELIQIVEVVGSLSPTALLVALGVWAWRNRNQQDERESVEREGWQSILSATVTNIAAQTQAVERVAARVETVEQQVTEASTMITGVRRDASAHHASTTETLTQIQAAIDNMPHETAERVRAGLRDDLDKILQQLTATALAVGSLRNKLDVLRTTSDSNKPKPETNDNAKQEATNDGKPSNVD